MKHFALDARMVRLQVTVGIRRLGLWPWLVLIGWTFFSAGQEPRLLRSFGMNLCWQGTWFGATILLTALCCLVEPATPTTRILRLNVITGLGLTCIVALAQAILAFAAEALTGPAGEVLDVPRSAIAFLLAWAPAGVACVCATARGGALTAKLLLALPFTFSLSVSALWFSTSSVSIVVACILATAGAMFVSVLAVPRAVCGPQRPPASPR